MQQAITITGATGNIGKVIVERLIQGGIKVRAVARNAEKLNQLKSKGAESFSGDLADSVFLAEAFQGADAVFAMIPPYYHLPDYREIQNQIAIKLTDAIKSSGVKFVVALSSIGADLSEGTGQIEILNKFESILENIPGTSVVILRPTFFMENHLGSIPLIKNSGINGSIFDPDYRFGMIATKDIAAVAAKYLSELNFSGSNVYYLLGSRDYSYSEATSILGKSIGNPDLPYIKFSSDDFINGLIQAGFSSNAAKDLHIGFTAFNEGRLTKNLKRNISNTTPTTLEEFAKDIFAPAFINETKSKDMAEG